MIAKLPVQGASLLALRGIFVFDRALLSQIETVLDAVSEADSQNCALYRDWQQRRTTLVTARCNIRSFDGAYNLRLRRTSRCYTAARLALNTRTAFVRSFQRMFPIRLVPYVPAGQKERFWCDVLLLFLAQTQRNIHFRNRLRNLVKKKRGKAPATCPPRNPSSTLTATTTKDKGDSVSTFSPNEQFSSKWLRLGALRMDRSRGHGHSTRPNRRQRHGNASSSSVSVDKPSRVSLVFFYSTVPSCRGDVRLFTPNHETTFRSVR